MHFFGDNVGHRILILAALLAAGPAMAEDIQYDNHTLQVEDNAELRRILQISGPLYQVRGSSQDLVGKARGCLAGIRGVSILDAESDDVAVVSDARFDYRAMFSARSVRSRLSVQVGDGRFQLVHTQLGMAQAKGSEAADDAYVALLYRSGGSGDALDVLLAGEQGLVDCMYR